MPPGKKGRGAGGLAGVRRYEDKLKLLLGGVEARDSEVEREVGETRALLQARLQAPGSTFQAAHPVVQGSNPRVQGSDPRVRGLAPRSAQAADHFRR